LWGIFFGRLFGALPHATSLARRCGQAEWAGLLLFVALLRTSA